MADSLEETTPAPRSRSRAIAQTPLVLRWLIRIRAYFLKEIYELRRQPMLILSLVGGPLLVLVLFGSTFRNSNPTLRTAIVLPPGGVEGLSLDKIRSLAGTNFTIESVSEDRAAAEAALRAGELDVVQVLPGNVMEMIRNRQSPQIEFLSNAINPLNEGWIQYLGYAEVNEINKELLRQETIGAQQQASDVRVKVSNARGQIAELEGQATPEQQQETQLIIRDLREDIANFERRLPAEGTILGSQTDVADLRRQLITLDDDLQTIDQAITDGKVQERVDEIRAAGQDLEQLEGVIDIFVQTPADIVVAPVRQSYSNIRGSAYAAVVYYTPGVLALLVQHTAITLGALALVRERLLGAFEVFRVAPVNMSQLLIGKYLGYTLFVGVMTALLVAGLLLIGIPLLGDIWQFVGMILLLTIASLGVGFLISTVSKSDSQAIQLAMITLLLSIFFSGFFISLDSFAWPALVIGSLIPMTHGVSGFQNLMLRGLAPTPVSWIALLVISIVTFVLVVAITRRQLEKA